MRVNVGKTNIYACHRHCTIIIHTHRLEGMPTLSRCSSGAYPSVISFITNCVWPVHIDDAREGIFGIRIVCIGVQCYWMFDFDFCSSTHNFDVWCSVKDNNIKNTLDLILFLVSNGDFNWIIAIVGPCPIQHTVERFDSSPSRSTCSIIPWDIE